MYYISKLSAFWNSGLLQYSVRHLMNTYIASFQYCWDVAEYLIGVDCLGVHLGVCLAIAFSEV